MKQKSLNSIRLRVWMLVAVLCTAFAGQAWADTVSTLTFKAACGGSGTAKLDDSDGSSGTVNWAITSDASESTYEADRGIHYGTNSVSVTYIQLSTSSFTSGTISKVEVYASGNNSPSLSVTVGGNAFGSTETGITTSNTKYTFTGSASAGTIVVRLAKASSAKKALYVKSIAVTYSTASGEETTTTISAAGITNTNKFVSTNAGSLSASVTYGDPATAVPKSSVTWSGDNDEVATINSSTGAVTLVGAGTVTFTASYAGVADTYKSSSDTYEMTVTNRDPDLEEIWSEDFGDYDADDVPSGGTYSYSCTDGGGTTKIYEQNTAGGTSPELLVAKSSGTFSVTIPLLYPSYGYSGDLTLTFKSNAVAVNVKTTTDGITVDGEASAGAGLTFTTKDTHTVTFEGVTTSTEEITIVFTTTTSSNVRLDDIVLEGKKAALTKVATPAISPTSGAIVSGTEVTITCATDGASIYYTADGTTPTSSSTAYNPASKPTITTATTIKAIAVKAGLTDSNVASASYTIASPCATPTFSIEEGVVDKGTSVTLSCETDGATIYYTTNGSTPTTSSSVYSSAITINASQTIKAIAAKDGMANSTVASATYTVRDFVNLPFSFNNGKSSIDTTTGLTESGLGSDYNKVDYTKLKFDDTGDYVILKFNSAPVVLTYSITGNSFSGGTFKLQYSADGSSYTDLKSYTSLTGSTLNEEFYNIPTTARYIKWVYTTKSSGNVGMGNIKLVEAEQVTIGATGYTTHVTTHKLSFPTDMKAYIATATESSYVTLSEVAKVPADKAIILNATAGTYNLPVTTDEASDVSGNLLKASDGSVVADGSTIYALGVGKSGVNAGVVGFYLVKKDETIPAGKAYLTVPANVKEFLTFVFDDLPTTVSEVKNDGVNSEKSIFNLAGQKMSKLQKGVNIVNGKKVLVK